MARRPITFRNIANTVAGNAASALSSAVSAFGVARQGSDVLRQQALDREAATKQELTDRFLANVMADGSFDRRDMANLPAGADIPVLVDRFTKDREAASIQEARRVQGALQEAQTDHQSELASALAYSNTPEQRTLEATRAEQEALQKQQELDLRKLNLDTQRERLNFDLQQSKNAEANIKARDAINLDWDNFVGKGTATMRADHEKAIAALNGRVASGEMSQADADQLANTLSSELGNAVREWGDVHTNDFLTQQRQKNKGLSDAIISASNPGLILDEQEALARERAKIRAKSQADYQEKQMIALDGLAAGSPTNLNKFRIGEDNQLVPLSTPKEISDNTVSKGEAYQWVSEQDGWWNIADFDKDEELPKKAKLKVDAMLRASGGNRQIFFQLMKDTRYDSEMFVKDEVHGIPTEEWANESLKGFFDQARAMQKNVRGLDRPAQSATSNYQKLVDSITGS